MDKVEYLVIDDTVDLGKAPAPVTNEAERKFRDDLMELVKNACQKN